MNNSNIVSYFILLCFLIACGFLIGYCSLSVWWAIIPMLIGGFVGSYLSPFAKALIDPRIDPAVREKALKTVRILTLGWTLLSGIFLAMGYSFLYFVNN